MNNPKKLAHTYNLLLNLFWSALSLVPLTVFCYTWLPANHLLIFLGFSLLPVFLSRAGINALQISRHAATYKKLGVLPVLHLSQNGRLMQALLRKRYPDYKVLRFSKRSINAVLQQTYLYEKFHLIGFLFFLLATVHALWNGLYFWSLTLSFLNLLYNVYPVLLQQYIRVKLVRFAGAKAAKAGGSHLRRTACRKVGSNLNK